MIAFAKKNPLFTTCILTLVLQTVLIVYYGFNGFYGQDSYEYLHITRALHLFYTTGIQPDYTVYPIMYPVVCSLFNFFIPDTFFAMQLVSILSTLFAIVLISKIITLLTSDNRYRFLYILLFFVLSPYVLRFSIIAMSDMLCITFWLATYYFSLQFSINRKPSALWLTALFAGLAVATRYPAVVLLLLPAWICLKTIIREKKYVLLLGVVIVILATTVPDYIIRQRIFFWNINSEGADLSYHFFAEQFRVINLFKNNFMNLDGVQQYPFPNIVFVFYHLFHPAFIFCGIILLWGLRKKENRTSDFTVMVIVLVLYSLFIGCNPYQNNRYLLFAFPLVLFIYFLPFKNWLERSGLGKKYLFYWVIPVICIQILLFTMGFRVTNTMHKTEVEITRHLKNLPQKTIYTMGIDGAVSAYLPESDVVNLFNVDIDTAQLHNVYVLFNEAAFGKQFAGLRPMHNFNLCKETGNMREVKVFNEGWVLYEIN